MTRMRGFGVRKFIYDLSCQTIEVYWDSTDWIGVGSLIAETTAAKKQFEARG